MTCSKDSKSWLGKHPCQKRSPSTPLGKAVSGEIWVTNPKKQPTWPPYLTMHLCYKHPRCHTPVSSRVTLLVLQIGASSARRSLSYRNLGECPMFPRCWAGLLMQGRRLKAASVGHLIVRQTVKPPPPYRPNRWGAAAAAARAPHGPPSPAPRAATRRAPTPVPLRTATVPRTSCSERSAACASKNIPRNEGDFFLGGSNS